MISGTKRSSRSTLGTAGVGRADPGSGRRTRSRGINPLCSCACAMRPSGVR
uniref:Uncharacterized protein n=1 Tax=Triticum urartu TaxID=4572 RepID=A0A8R7K5Q7_TRIUA